MSRFLRVIAAALVALIAHAPAVRAQLNEGRFTGTVLDASGAAVPGARVVVKNERTGEERTVTTNEQGRYVVTGLRPSTYTIKAAFDRFSPLEYT